MKLLHCTAVMASLLSCVPARSADPPVFDGEFLRLPRVDTPTQLGAFQEGVLRQNRDGTWSIVTLKTLNQALSPDEQRPTSLRNITWVEVVATTTPAMPVAVFLKVMGWEGRCPSGTPTKIYQRREGSQISINLSVGLRSGANCPAQVYDYRVTVPLDVYGLPAGTYTYTINNQYSGTFTLARENKYADDCDLSIVCPYIPIPR